MNININTFNEWADLGKDKSMAKNHEDSVNKMFDIIKEKGFPFSKPFNFLDIGCGNGWVVRKALDYKNCNYALGIDGAKNMIKIANTYNKGSFLTKDIDKYNFENKFNLIFSMETLYYLKDISELLTKIYNDGLHKNGILIIGLDHYKENEPSLSWGDDYNLDISTLSIEEWKNKLTESKFRNIDIIQFNKKDDWQGSLIISCTK